MTQMKWILLSQEHPPSCCGKGSSGTEIWERTGEAKTVPYETSHGPSAEPSDVLHINNFSLLSAKHCSCEILPAQRYLSDYRKETFNCSLLNNLKNCNPKIRPKKIPHSYFPVSASSSPQGICHAQYSYFYRSPYSSAQFMVLLSSQRVPLHITYCPSTNLAMLTSRGFC